MMASLHVAEKSLIFSIVFVTKNSQSVNVIENREASVDKGYDVQYHTSL